MTTSSQNISQNDFQFVKQLGTGSFGTVNLVKKKQTQQLLAIKSVSLSKLCQKQKDSALNQVRLLASIRIPYVISYKGAYFNTDNQSLCIVMQYADGGDLQNKISDLKDTTEVGFQEKFIWKVAFQIFSGLKILHRNKIIHRDIKSANIFFAGGIAKLGDMNVSKVAEQGMCQTQTGTPYYTSPQIWKGEKYTSKCDIWSTGCLLYEMCTLTHPFKGADFPSLYRKVIVGNYQQIPSSYSHQLKELIRMCLTVDDQMRPSASELLQTSILSGMESNMNKFGSDGEVSLIDPIKCPRVLRFLNSKLPKPNNQDSSSKIVNFATKKQIQKTQGHGFKIHKQQNLRRIRSEKIIPVELDQQQRNLLMKVASKKQIKLPPLQKDEVKPLNFNSNKKLKVNGSMKKLASHKHIVIDSSKNIGIDLSERENGQIKKNNPSVLLTNGSRKLISNGSSRLIPSNKNVGSSKQIVINQKQNKLYL